MTKQLENNNSGDDGFASMEDDPQQPLQSKQRQTHRVSDKKTMSNSITACQTGNNFFNTQSVPTPAHLTSKKAASPPEKKEAFDSIALKDDLIRRGLPHKCADDLATKLKNFYVNYASKMPLFLLKNTAIGMAKDTMGLYKVKFDDNYKQVISKYIQPPQQKTDQVKTTSAAVFTWQFQLTASSLYCVER